MTTNANYVLSSKDRGEILQYIFDYYPERLSEPAPGGQCVVELYNPITQELVPFTINIEEWL